MAAHFHPNLPGAELNLVEHQFRTWRAAGWRLWDELSDEQQNAHNEAVAKEAAEQATSLDLDQPTAPSDGDTPKE